MTINEFDFNDNEGAWTDDELHQIVEEGAPLPDLTEKDCDEIFYENQVQMIELLCPQKGKVMAKGLYEKAQTLQQKIRALEEIRDVIGHTLKVKTGTKKQRLFMHCFISVEQFRSGENLSIGQSFTLDAFWERCKSTKQKRLAIIDYCNLNYEHFLTDPKP